MYVSSRRAGNAIASKTNDGKKVTHRESMLVTTRFAMLTKNVNARIT